jgi:hypothetical protein
VANNLLDLMISLIKRLFRALRAVLITGFILAICAFMLLWISFGEPNQHYEEKIISFNNVGDEVRDERYCLDCWCSVRISIHDPDASGSWTPVLVYDDASIDIKDPRGCFERYIGTNFEWLNSKELEISISQVDQIIYRKDEVGGRKISFNVGRSVCPDKENTDLWHYLRGEYWTHFKRDLRCVNFIDMMENARSDMRNGADKAEVWRWLHERGVTDQDIWRIGL